MHAQRFAGDLRERDKGAGNLLDIVNQGNILQIDIASW